MTYPNTRLLINGSWVDAKDKKTLAVFAGMQASMFGLNGLPFFDATNTYLLGQWLYNNPEHKDMYSVLPTYNKELGDWLLYGTASAFPLFTGSFPALYSRGDINPRHITILPTNIVDVPAVTPEITPEVPIVATEVLLLDQVPPVVVFDTVVVPAAQIFSVPVIAGTVEVAVTTRSSIDILGRLPVVPPVPLW
jgi:hypothetical protein